MELVPDEIRAIRERLGLSQAAAGRLLGGGPSAFTKYEAGTLRPAASLVNLLRVLEANPAAITTLGGRMPRPIANHGTRPFEVTGRHIEALTDGAGRMFAELLKRLLFVEAQVNDVLPSRIHVASSMTTPDGGEDGRIEWTGGPDRTRFLPGRLCQFQLKGGRIKPSAARRDVLTTSGEVKDMVRSVLAAEGHYIVLCSHSYVQKEIIARQCSIRAGLRAAGVTVADEQIDFRDANQIAQWANHYPSVAIWVKEQTHEGSIGPFRSWSDWAGRPEHDRSPWVDDGRLPALRSQLRERIMMTTPGIARVVGPWGVGKSRLVLEAFRPTAQDDAEDRGLSDFILYAVESENRSEEVYSAVQSLVDATARAVVVVDCCLTETHRVLAGMVSRAGSRVSIVTIDDDLSDATPDETTIKVDEAPSSVTEAIVNRSLPKLWPGDQSRLSRFSKGCPEVAIRLGEAWGRSIPISHVTDDDLVDAIILGHRPHEPDLLLKSARLIAVFGMVAVTETADGQLEEIATLGRNLTADDLRAAIEDFVRRGVVQRRGRHVVFRPLAIALKLAERQWREWSPETREAVLSGNASAHLKVLAARGLACLNTTGISQEVVERICRFGGALDGWNGIAETAHAEVLSALAEVNAEAVVGQIDRSLEDVDDLSVVGRIRRHLVWALEKIAFRSDTFRDGARLLMRLAIAENETCANNATGQFTDLFRLGGNTEADGAKRLDFLDEVGDTTKQVQRTIVVDAIAAGLSFGGFMTIYGAESHGSRPALERWTPTTIGQRDDYITGCVTRLSKFAIGQDESGVTARGRLARCLSTLIRHGYISTVESVVNQVVGAVGYWPEAHESLGQVLVHPSDSMDQDVIERVRNLIEELHPKSLELRVRFLVTHMPRYYPYERNADFRARGRRQTAAIHALASEIAKQPAVLKGVLPELNQGEQRVAYAFGKAVASCVESPPEWLASIIEFVEQAPAGNRNHDLLWGYLAGIAADYPDAVEALKRRAAKSSELAPILPRICSHIGINASDIELVVAALRAGLLRPSELIRWRWEIVTASTSAVALLLEAMLDQGGDALTEAVEMLGVYIDRAPERLEYLRPQIIRLVGDIVQPGPRGKIDEYTFGEIVKWALDKGRKDADANAVALLLARAVVETEEHDDKRVIRPLMPRLLSGFPEIAWQLIGPAIVADRGFAMLMELVLGEGFAFDRDYRPAILCLPEDVLFAWCHGHPDSAPAFAAGVVPVLTLAAEDPECSLHPIMTRLINEFGDRKEVLSAIDRNMHTFGWSGSLTTYYELYEKPLGTLRDHPTTEVRRWAAKMLRRLAAEIENARRNDEEEYAESELP